MKDLKIMRKRIRRRSVSPCSPPTPCSSPQQSDMSVDIEPPILEFMILKSSTVPVINVRVNVPIIENHYSKAMDYIYHYLAMTEDSNYYLFCMTDYNNDRHYDLYTSTQSNQSGISISDADQLLEIAIRENYGKTVKVINYSPNESPIVSTVEIIMDTYELGQ